MIKKIILMVAIVGSGLIFFTNKAKAFEDENIQIYDTNINIPAFNMDNDVWLEGNMLNDVYYRYDIIINDIVYSSFQEIEQLYIDDIISPQTLLYIDLDPRYNFIFAKLQDQGNGLFYWQEYGTINKEEPSDIRTIIINKNGLNIKNDNFNSSWTQWFWSDFDISNNVLGNSLIGYENQISIDYYDYYTGYYGGYWDGRNEGYRLGEKFGYGEGKNFGYNEGYDIGVDDGYNTGYGVGYNKGSGENLETAGFGAVLFAGFGAIGAILQVELLPNITIGAIVAIPIVFGVVMFIIGRRKE